MYKCFYILWFLAYLKYFTIFEIRKNIEFLIKKQLEFLTPTIFRALDLYAPKHKFKYKY